MTLASVQLREFLEVKPVRYILVEFESTRRLAYDETCHKKEKEKNPCFLLYVKNKNERINYANSILLQTK